MKASPHPPTESEQGERPVGQSFLVLGGPEDSALKIQSRLEQTRPRTSRVILGGSEPLMHPELPAIIGAARALEFSELAIQTNARALYPVERNRLLLNWGLDEIIVCLHSQRPKEHNIATGAAHFEQSCRGARAWVQAGGTLSLQLMVGTWILEDPSAMLTLVRALRPRRVELIYGRSAEGWSEVHEDHQIDIFAAAQAMHTFQRTLQDQDIPATTSGVPACAMPTGAAEALSRLDLRVETDGLTRPLRRLRDLHKVSVAACASCAEAPRCEGVWRSAAESIQAPAGTPVAPTLPTLDRPIQPELATDTQALHQELHTRGLCPPDNILRSHMVHELYVMYSFSCHLRCDYCWLWGEPGAVWDRKINRTYADRMSIENMTRLIDELVPYGIRYLNLSGGEPLMTRTWHPLAMHARKKGLPVALTTGGVLVEKHLDQLIESVDQLNISLNGPPSIAERVRPGPKGHYESMMRGMRLLSEYKRNSETGGPRLRILSTVTDTNYAHMTELVEYLQGENIEIDQLYIQFLIFVPPDLMAAQEEVLRDEFGKPLRLLNSFRYAPEGIDFDVFWEQVQGVRELFPEVQFSAPLDRKSLERYYTGHKSGIVPNSCSTPWTELALLPNGDLYTCPDLPIGNICTESFEDIWNGHMIQQLRKRLMSEHLPACTGCFHYWGDRGSKLTHDTPS